MTTFRPVRYEDESGSVSVVECMGSWYISVWATEGGSPVRRSYYMGEDGCLVSFVSNRKLFGTAEEAMAFYLGEPERNDVELPERGIEL